MSSEDKDGGILSFLVGMGIGAAAGAIGALMYAPRAGADTRRGVAEAVGELRGRADKLAEQVRATTHEVSEKLRQDLDTAVTAGKEAAAARRAELERAVRGE
jgi:gas vesicle protein